MHSSLGPLMFVAAFLLIFTGYPVALSLGGTALVFALIGMANGMFDWHFLFAMSDRIFGILSNYVLLAIPFFIFMGTLLEKSKLAEDLLQTIGELFGRMRGGLGLAVVFVGTLLAAATGVVGASVTAMGMISLPIMLRQGYSKTYSAGLICAAGTLGQIIPPSVVLVVLADQMSLSVGDLFMGALKPGLMLAGFYALYTLALAFFKPEHLPAMPRRNESGGGAVSLKQALKVMLPPLVLILLVLGSIFIGLATPTEAGALGSIGAILLALANGRLTRPRMLETMDHTTRITAMVVFLLIGSTAFALVFRGLYGDIWIDDLLLKLPGGKLGLLLTANLAFFILGCFLDFFEIAFIILPLLAPVAQRMGIDMVWFAVILGMNLQTSFLTPPFGFSLFYLRGIAPPELKTSEIYRGVVPFIGLQLLALLMLYLFPGLVH